VLVEFGLVVGVGFGGGGSYCWPGWSGGTYPARIFARYMKPALANVDVQDLFTASPDDLSLHRLDAVPTLPTTSTPSSSSTSSTTTMPPAVIEGQAQPPEPQQPPSNQNQPQYQPPPPPRTTPTTRPPATTTTVGKQKQTASQTTLGP